MSIEQDIATHEAILVALRKKLARGYEVGERNGFEFEEYTLRDDHEVVYDTDGNFAGIVINQKIMTNYFRENPYDA
jgi:hypothetical protein